MAEAQALKEELEIKEYELSVLEQQANDYVTFLQSHGLLEKFDNQYLIKRSGLTY